MFSVELIVSNILPYEVEAIVTGLRQFFRVGEFSHASTTLVIAGHSSNTTLDTHGTNCAEVYRSWAEAIWRTYMKYFPVRIDCLSRGCLWTCSYLLPEYESWFSRICGEEDDLYTVQIPSLIIVRDTDTVVRQMREMENAVYYLKDCYDRARRQLWIFLSEYFSTSPIQFKLSPIEKNCRAVKRTDMGWNIVHSMTIDTPLNESDVDSILTYFAEKLAQFNGTASIIDSSKLEITFQFLGPKKFLLMPMKVKPLMEEGLETRRIRKLNIQERRVLH